MPTKIRDEKGVEIIHWIVMTGNPISGMLCHGPFKSPETAAEFADSFDDCDFLIAELLTPEII